MIAVGLNSGDSHAVKECCSRHGGIANCDEAAGYYRCKDGQISPCQCKPSAPFSWFATVENVIDGQTIDVEREGRRQRIRLYGVVCPERHPKVAEQARQFLVDQVRAKTVQVSPVLQDRYGITFAWVSRDGIHLSQALIQEGLAYWDRRRAPDETDLKELESQATKARKGIWWQGSREVPAP